MLALDAERGDDGMWTRERVFEVLGATGVVGILMLVFSPPIPNATISAIVQNIGMAFLVAGIVGITVEVYVRAQTKLQMDKMLEEIGADVFKASLKHEFPDSIWDQLYTHLLLNPVMRRDVTIDYSLESLPESGGQFLKTRTCWSYTVYNLNTTREWLYPLAAALDRCLDPRFSAQTDFNKVEVDGQPLQDLEKQVCETEVTCRATLTLRPGESKKVTIYGESVYRSDQVIPFSMTDSTENLTVIVSKPPSIAVTVDPLHPREERLKELPTAPPESRRVWILVGGLLPGHGVIIRWFPY